MSYKLDKPYTDDERADFIVLHNHTNGLLIEETETALYALEAWEVLEGDTIIDNTEEYNKEQLLKAKEAKIQEATDKAYSFEQTDALITVKATNAMTRVSDLYHIEGHFTNMIKISAYAQSMGDEEILPWNTKENINVVLNKIGCAQLSALMQQMNVKLWTVDFPTYIAQIDACETVEEVNAINIEYQSPPEVVDINITPVDGQEEPTEKGTNENTIAE